MRLERTDSSFGRVVRRGFRAVWLVLAVAPLAGCVTLAEYRKLERDVRELQYRAAPRNSGQIADTLARLDKIEAELRGLEGRLEVTEHRVGQVLEEARAARAEASQAGARIARDEASPARSGPVGPPPGGNRTAAGDDPVVGEDAGGASSSDEVQAYRGAYAAWRGDDAVACIDRFRKFLQTYPSSSYADDAAYWMADCYFKQGDFKTAILRFDDVVARYPGGNKAADALYRQGEALLRLGPGYTKAAGKAFERVIQEYPGSERASEARRQLDLLRSG